MNSFRLLVYYATGPLTLQHWQNSDNSSWISFFTCITFLYVCHVTCIQKYPTYKINWLLKFAAKENKSADTLKTCWICIKYYSRTKQGFHYKKSWPNLQVQFFIIFLVCLWASLPLSPFTKRLPRVLTNTGAMYINHLVVFKEKSVLFETFTRHTAYHL